MTSLDLMMAISVFLVVAPFSYALLRRLLPNEGLQRLSDLAQKDPPTDMGWFQRFKTHLRTWILWLSPWTMGMSGGDEAMPSALRIRFWNAGWHSTAADRIYFTSKTLLTLVLPTSTWGFLWLIAPSLSDMNMLAVTALIAAAGYYLPDGILRYQIKQRQKTLFHAFPDALDLLRVCVQAGLGLDAAMERVGHEMRLSSPELSDEFELTGLALRAGASRAQALRSLAVRIGIKDIDALVSMLIQADRFGTSIAESLQVHSDALRTKRRLLAEEIAAKLPVKLLIPLIFCVFPALLTVLLGPVVISLYTQLVKPAI